MKKPTFCDWVRKTLSIPNIGAVSDEELCGRYVQRYYPVYPFCSHRRYAVMGKKYESCRKMLSEMRRKGEIIEITRDVRKNGSEEIFFTI